MPQENLTGDNLEATQTPSTEADVDATTDATDVSNTPDAEISPSSSEPDAPDATDADEPQTMADAIEAALEAEATETPGEDDPDPDADDASDNDDAGQDSDNEPVDSDGPDDNDDEADADPTDEEIEAMKPSSRRRVKQLLSQRNEARREVETLQGDATNYQQIRQFMSTNNLVDQEVAELFQLGADLKSGNPERLGKFLERVMPTVQAAMEATGQAIPADLQTQVDAGEMTEDAAKAMSQTRAARTHAQQAADAATQREQATRTQVSQQQIVTAVNQWQQQVSQTDPDFDMKAAALQRATQAIVAEKGLPSTPTQAVEYAKAAYAEVNSWMKSARPAPKATRQAPSSETAPKSGLTPAPTSLADVIEQGLKG